ncbi:Glyoxylate/hydroxypyruvate reductase B [Pigmentiphaga humi]|uniref:Glyoxylate/hydroxypyruvate reductase B n=1 Tax=Pigmentiphaga humi TaxID=2478468 RepID=A0A3P4AZM2_9BURK|nr:NAD(P)-dependent oxidoreductase [Pigmentiphaga humi]VCU69519.1 Glyoxylate/hydroxypyruvate reductase B [Pigmentiphaga humi]
MPTQVLSIIALPPAMREGLGRHYQLHDCAGGPDTVDWTAPALAQVRAVVTNGSIGFTSQQMDRLPGLAVICAMGAGTENIDVEAAKARNIAVTNSAGANAATVADHALGLALALARGYRPISERLARGEAWSSLRAPRPSLDKSRVGIIGMGQIGRMVAARAAACGAAIAYHGPSAKSDAPGTYYPDLIEMARDSEFLFACCPGGPRTRHLLDARVFEALGPRGFVINVSRGTVLKTADLLEALRQGKLAGAGLDVLEEEPAPPPALVSELAGMDNVLLTPHISGRSPAAVLVQLEILLESLDDALAGRRPRYAVDRAGAEG